MKSIKKRREFCAFLHHKFFRKRIFLQLQRGDKGRAEGASQRPKGANLSAGLCRMFERNLPAGKYKHGWMTLEGMSKNFGALNTQIYPPILDG